VVRDEAVVVLVVGTGGFFSFEDTGLAVGLVVDASLEIAIADALFLIVLEGARCLLVAESTGLSAGFVVVLCVGGFAVSAFGAVEGFGASFTAGAGRLSLASLASLRGKEARGVRIF
jgi:hypothetical protein